MHPRRGFLAGMLAAASALVTGRANADEITPGLTALTAPFELTGDWGDMLPESVLKVLEITRRSCLSGVRLVSDREPNLIRVQEITSGSPAIWLHPDRSRTAWVLVDIGERAWIQLAYQFGHEFGHIVCNSWLSHAKPSPPCQWLEEALVEAFSIHGLGHLAAKWRTAPPFPDDNAYADAIVQYRDDWVQKFTGLAAETGCLQDFGGWFRANRTAIEALTSRADSQAAAAVILQEFDRAEGCIEALGALNRWPRRSAVPLADYLRLWEESCVELGADTTLPTRLREMLGPV